MKTNPIQTNDFEFEALLTAGILEYCKSETKEIETFLQQVQDGIPRIKVNTTGYQCDFTLRNTDWFLVIYRKSEK